MQGPRGGLLAAKWLPAMDINAPQRKRTRGLMRQSPDVAKLPWTLTASSAAALTAPVNAHVRLPLGVLQAALQVQPLLFFQRIAHNRGTLWPSHVFDHHCSHEGMARLHGSN